METAKNMVAAFHEKYGVSPAEPMRTARNIKLKRTAESMLQMASVLEDFIKVEDMRTLRAHLVLEEAGEFIDALADGDEIRALDGLMDLLYVALGTAVTFDWPVMEAFVEVHSSNMTKIRKEGDAGRVRDKGTTFRPPELRPLLAAHRGVEVNT